MHYSFEDILDRAEDIGDGYRKTTVTLGPEDTAHSALSTKWDLQGPGEVTYLIHPSGITVGPSETITRAFNK